MRVRSLALLFVSSSLAFGLGSCAETKQDGATAPVAAAAAEVRWEIEAWKETAAPAACAADPDAGAPEADPDAGAGASAGSSESVISAIRSHVRSCYDELLAQDPGAHGRIVQQVFTRKDGSVCAVRPTLRVGLSPQLGTCVERMVRGARFEGVPSPLAVPLTYTMKRADGALYGHPARVDVQSCAAKVAVPTEATFAYLTDANGQPGDIAVDPWKGDQAALECTADAIKKTKHAASSPFVLSLRFHP